jgi:hydrogenase maturation protein HypF
LQRLHGVTATAMVRDTHPDYASTHHALAQGLPVRAVPHHLAHAWAVLAEHGLSGPVLAVTWDGTGHGGQDAHAIWGGEFLRVEGARWERVAHLREFSLPGGERAVREPRLAALGLLHEIFGAALWQHAPPGWAEGFTDEERIVLPRLLGQGINSPRTTSAGRLFDGLASLLGLRQGRGFEGQAAMALEFAADDAAAADDGFAAALPLTGTAPIVLDWEPMLRGLVQRRAAGAPVPELAAACHERLVQGIVAVAQAVGEPTVVLGGGCWQNRRLLERAMAGLRGAGFTVYRPRLVPPNDGGLALGQLAAAAALEGN